MIEFLVVLFLGWVAWRLFKFCLGVAWLTFKVLFLLTLGATVLVLMGGHA